MPKIRFSFVSFAAYSNPNKKSNPIETAVMEGYIDLRGEKPAVATTKGCMPGNNGCTTPHGALEASPYHPQTLSFWRKSELQFSA